MLMIQMVSILVLISLLITINNMLGINFIYQESGPPQVKITSNKINIIQFKFRNIYLNPSFNTKMNLSNKIYQKHLKMMRIYH